jgi:hypothetical protein
MTRKALIARVTKHGAALRTLGKKTVEITWLLAEDLVQLQGTFPQGEEGKKAFKATAATASGKGESMIDNLVRAVAVRESLTDKQRERTAEWSYDSVLVMAGKDMTSGNRTKLIDRAEKANTRNVKDLRTFKTAIVGKTSRNRQSQTDANVKLAKDLGDTFAKLAKSHDVLALIAGAQLAQDHPGKDVAAALVFWNAQVTTAAPVVAK